MGKKKSSYASVHKETSPTRNGGPGGPSFVGKFGGQGRDRTVDLPIFSRTLVPTELPGRDAEGYQDPSGAFGEDFRFLDWSGA